MKLSTRSRYGIRLLFELAMNQEDKPMLLSEIGKKQKISKKYLSNIIVPLKANKYVNSSRGAYGGYVLAKKPEEINMYEAVNTLEGDLTIIDCINGSVDCDQNCPTKEMWKDLNGVINDYLKKITLRDLIEKYKHRLNDEASMYYI